MKSPSTASPRKRTIWIGALTAVAAVIVVILITTQFWSVSKSSPVESTGEFPAEPGDSASAEVSDEGISLELDGVTVSAGPDVAPAGTSITANLVTPPSLAEFADFAAARTSAVDIEIAGGRQPESPITITFDVAGVASGSNLFVLGESDEEGRDVEFMETQRNDHVKELTTTTEHLSWFTVVEVDEVNLRNKFGEWLDVAISVRSTKPNCVDEVDAYSGTYTFASPWPDTAWVCTQETASGVTVTLQSNSGLVFELESEPEGEFSQPTALNSEGLATASLVLQLQREGMLRGDGVLLAGGSIDVAFPKPFDSAHFTLRVEPGLTQVSTLMWGIEMLLPDKWAAGIELANCAGDGLTSVVGGGGSEQFSAIMGCAATAMGDTAGELLEIIMKAPGKLVTQIEGIVREVQDGGVEEFDVYLVSEHAVREIPPSATWLYELPHSGSQTSGDADIAILQLSDDFASFPLSTNQWVGCEGSANTVKYTLDGQWESVSFAFALQSHTPRGLLASWSVLADGEEIYSDTAMRGDELERIELDVRGVQSLEFAAQTDDECTVADKGYAALVQAFVDAG